MSQATTLHRRIREMCVARAIEKPTGKPVGKGCGSEGDQALLEQGPKETDNRGTEKKWCNTPTRMAGGSMKAPRYLTKTDQECDISRR
ncbi:hypothetical protein [Burkholderia sp. NLJ2]|uniref:hypothetical protein n=1 Tax=Burkholderia sp. NLJ2 TaxID=3090699 RepID=UPI003C6C66BA